MVARNGAIVTSLQTPASAAAVGSIKPGPARVISWQIGAPHIRASKRTRMVTPGELALAKTGGMS